jgi:MFS family permease
MLRRGLTAAMARRAGRERVTVDNAANQPTSFRAIGAIHARVREAFAAFASNARSRNLRRAQLSFGAAWAAEWAYTVALSIVAFRDGGAAAVGLVAMLRLGPAAVAGPFMGALIDRFSRDRMIVWIGVVRTLAIGASAVVVASGGAIAVVYGLAVIATIAVTPLRATHSALLPSLCKSPEELTGAMVTRGLLDSLSVLLGPLVASGLLVVGGPEAALLGVAALSLWSALLALALDYEAPPRLGTAVSAAGVRAQIGEGLRAIASSRDVALMATLFCAQTFTRGCLMVFSVVVAVDLLSLGEPGVGLLNGAVGAGAVLGSLGAALLVGSRRLGAWLVVAVALWGIPFVLIGAFPGEAAALVLLGLVGVANAIEDVSFFTLVGRVVPDELLGRVFGAIESAVAISVGFGALMTPLLIDLVGLRGALAVLGAVCPTLAVLALARLRMLDRTLEVRTREIGVLRNAPMLRALPAVTIEHLARDVEHVTFEPGEVVCVQGEPGNAFYVIESGEVEVLGDGKRLCTLGPGDSFGEIALIHDTPRTATVLARTTIAASSLTRAQFLPVVSGYGASAQEADAVVGNRLAAFPGTAR